MAVILRLKEIYELIKLVGRIKKFWADVVEVKLDDWR